MAHSRGAYDVVVDIDDTNATGDLGQNALNDDLEFHNSTFDSSHNGGPKLQPDFVHPAGARGGPSSSSKRYLWSIGFYQQYFDVDTATVLHRCRSTLYPRANFLDAMDGFPDLYGPFWIATTVIVILFMTGTISQYLQEQGKDHFAYDFRLLSGAAGLIYGYTLFIPLGLWGVLRWFGSESANLMECWALYGYANLIWIPVALVSWSPLTVLNYAFTAVGFGLSALFLFRNLYPVIQATDAKTSRILLIVIVALHAGLAIAIKILFFAHGSPASKDKGKLSDAVGDNDGDGSNSLVRMFMGL